MLKMHANARLTFFFFFFFFFLAFGFFAFFAFFGFLAAFFAYTTVVLWVDQNRLLPTTLWHVGLRKPVFYSLSREFYP